MISLVTLAFSLAVEAVLSKYASNGIHSPCAKISKYSIEIPDKRYQHDRRNHS